MSLRLVTTVNDLPRQSITIAVAAARASVNPSTIRKALHDGAIEGHRVGKRGLRVYDDSFEDWRRGMTVIAKKDRRLAQTMAPKLSTAAQAEAEAFLRSLGVL